MSWASNYINKLKEKETVSFRPRGNSMVPKIKSGQLCTVAPIENYEILKKGDIVLCKVGRAQYLHLISAISANGTYQISNNKGHVNGWVSRDSIYGVLVSVEN